MTGLANGTRISYRQGRRITQGTIFATKNAMGADYYIVRTSTSALLVAVLPQYITTVY